MAVKKSGNINSKDISWRKVLLNTFLFLLSCFIGGIIYLFILSRDLPSIEELQRFNPEQVSKILSADGKVIKELFIYKRDVVKISHVRFGIHRTNPSAFLWTYTHLGNLLRSSLVLPHI